MATPAGPAPLATPDQIVDPAPPVPSTPISLKLTITHGGISPKSKPERSPLIYSSVLVNRVAVDYLNENAYLGMVDSAGNPKMPFKLSDLPIPSQRYQKNPVYPFSPVLENYTYAAAWAWDQAELHNFPIPHFNEDIGHWEFPTNSATKIGKLPAVFATDAAAKNTRMRSIICCHQIVLLDTEKNWSIYHAVLGHFASKLVEKAPVNTVAHDPDSSKEENVYTKYRYYFNTIGPFDQQKKYLVRSFACDSLDGEDVVEILMSDLLRMEMEEDVVLGQSGDSEGLVRLPGVNFACEVHPRYAQLVIYWVRYLPKV